MEVEAVRDCAIARIGDTLRGTNITYSTALVDRGRAIRVIGVTKGDGIAAPRMASWRATVVASYLHAHVYSMPHEFDLFVANANAFSRS